MVIFGEVVQMTAGRRSDWIKVGLVLSVSLLLLACHSGAHSAQPPSEQHSEQQSSQWSDQQLKQDVVGIWEEVDGTQETLQFNADGTLIMNSPSEHRSCDFSFPDSGHIRLDCTRYKGGPRASQTWKFAMTSDKVMIGDELVTGTYKRR